MCGLVGDLAELTPVLPRNDALPMQGLPLEDSTANSNAFPPKAVGKVHNYMYLVCLHDTCILNVYCTYSRKYYANVIYKSF